MPSKSLPLILARELASNLSTPMFLLDGEGMLVYCNDAAELLIGRSMAELGEITGFEFGEQIDLRHSDGTPMSGADSPAGVAFFQRRPAHRRARWTAFDGTRREVERDLVSVVRRAGAPARCRHRVLAAGRAQRRPLMRARVWGCRGSLAAPGPDTVRYGGNTSCVQVELESGHQLVLDAGTGMRPLGVAMNGTDGREIHILLTHLHLDHLQGLGFFRPLFQPGTEVHLWGPASPVQSLEARIATYLSPPLFPVHLSDLPAHIVFHDEPKHVEIGSAVVHAAYVAHQGPTVGYRIEENGHVLAYVPDHEPSVGITLEQMPPDWISGHEVAHGADVLFHDAQYGDDEYPAHVGWGHSAIDHTMALARKLEVDQVVLFHHDPYHTDDELEQLLDEREGTLQRARWKGLPRARRHDDDVRRGRSRDHVLTDGALTAGDEAAGGCGAC